MMSKQTSGCFIGEQKLPLDFGLIVKTINKGRLAVVTEFAIKASATSY